jgi:lysozyme family protein
MVPSLVEAAADYRKRWNEMTVSSGDKLAADAVARRILANKDRYLTLQQKLGVPWHWVSLAHYREANLSFLCHLHNGDSLRARTTHVPAGHPLSGDPPFTWEYSAIDALTMAPHQLDKIKDWSFGQYCYQLEKYNGWGYRGKGVTSSYLWAHSDQHESGKYVSDGVYDANAIDKQLGCLVVLGSLMALDPTIAHPPGGQTQAPATPVAPQESLLQRALSSVSGWFGK